MTTWLIQLVSKYNLYHQLFLLSFLIVISLFKWLNPVNSNELEKVITKLNNSKVKDEQGKDSLYLKQHQTLLAPVQTKNKNQSMLEDISPDSLEIAMVTPVYKSGDKQDISNCRSISILPAIFKVYEKVVAKQLMQDLDENAILNPLQFGFTRNYNWNCLLLLPWQIKSSLDQGGLVGTFFLDLWKAFDTLFDTMLFCSEN